KRLGKKGKAAGTGQRRKGAVQKRQEAAARKKKGAAEARRQAAARQESPAVARKKTAEERKAAAQKKKEQEAEAKREAAEAAKKAAIEVKMYPSLFVISLRYLVSLEKIDAVMKKHVAFLDKHFAVGDFLVSGRQVPRTGGIIVARAKDRASVERIMKQDPLLKGQLASVDIVEFTASKMDKGFDKLLRRGRG
ncbi:MAG TPA: YciI family protein, partial [Puia sp.]|nr:YciI family protein [Puia sp.]